MRFYQNDVTATKNKTKASKLNINKHQTQFKDRAHALYLNRCFSIQQADVADKVAFLQSSAIDNPELVVVYKARSKRRAGEVCELLSLFVDIQAFSPDLNIDI